MYPFSHIALLVSVLCASGQRFNLTLPEYVWNFCALCGVITHMISMFMHLIPQKEAGFEKALVMPRKIHPDHCNLSLNTCAKKPGYPSNNINSGAGSRKCICCGQRALHLMGPDEFFCLYRSPLRSQHKQIEPFRKSGKVNDFMNGSSLREFLCQDQRSG